MVNGVTFVTCGVRVTLQSFREDACSSINNCLMTETEYTYTLSNYRGTKAEYFLFFKCNVYERCEAIFYLKWTHKVTIEPWPLCMKKTYKVYVTSLVHIRRSWDVSISLAFSLFNYVIICSLWRNNAHATMTVPNKVRLVRSATSLFTLTRINFWHCNTMSSFAKWTSTKL